MAAMGMKLSRGQAAVSASFVRRSLTVTHICAMH
jgi:hypothetical protein